MAIRKIANAIRKGLYKLIYDVADLTKREVVKEALEILSRSKATNLRILIPNFGVLVVTSRTGI